MLNLCFQRKQIQIQNSHNTPSNRKKLENSVTGYPLSCFNCFLRWFCFYLETTNPKASELWTWVIVKSSGVKPWKSEWRTHPSQETKEHNHITTLNLSKYVMEQRTRTILAQLHNETPSLEKVLGSNRLNFLSELNASLHDYLHFRGKVSFCICSSNFYVNEYWKLRLIPFEAKKKETVSQTKHEVLKLNSCIFKISANSRSLTGIIELIIF